MRNPRAWIGLGVSAVTIVFLIRTVDFAKLIDALLAADLLLVAVCVATVPVSMYAKAYRWRLFFPEPERLSTNGLLSALYIGYMANTVLPLRVGELVRAYLTGESERVSKSTALATVLIEKVFDLGTIAFFLFLLQFVLALPAEAEVAARLAGIGLLLAAVGLGVALAARGLALRIAAGLEARFAPFRRLGVHALVESFLDGLAFLRSPSMLGQVVGWSVLMWSISCLSIYIGLGALGIWQGLPVAAFVMVALNLSMVVPSAPGYIGVFHAVVVEALAPYGVDRNQAAAAGFVLHAAIFLPFIVGGLYYLREGRGLGELVARAQSATTDAHAR